MAKRDNVFIFGLIFILLGLISPYAVVAAFFTNRLPPSFIIGGPIFSIPSFLLGLILLGCSRQTRRAKTILILSCLAMALLVCASALLAFSVGLTLAPGVGAPR